MWKQLEMQDRFVYPARLVSFWGIFTHYSVCCDLVEDIKPNINAPSISKCVQAPRCVLWKHVIACKSLSRCLFYTFIVNSFDCLTLL